MKKNEKIVCPKCGSENVKCMDGAGAVSKYGNNVMIDIAPDMWICEDIPLECLTVEDTSFSQTNDRFRRMLGCLPNIKGWQRKLIGSAVNLNAGWLAEPHTLHTDRLYRIDYEQIR